MHTNRFTRNGLCVYNKSILQGSHEETSKKKPQQTTTTCIISFLWWDIKNITHQKKKKKGWGGGAIYGNIAHDWGTIMLNVFKASD
jgi:hypothetical protein